MSNALKVNTEGDSTVHVLAKIYQSMPDIFNPHQWKMVSEAGVASSLEYDFDMRQATEEKVTTMFVPTPDKQITYSVYKLENGNPFQTLRAMDFIVGGVPFEQARGMITLNLMGGGRDVMVLFPNPRSATVDVYRIKKLKDTETISHLTDNLKNTKENTDMILDRTVKANYTGVLQDDGKINKSTIDLIVAKPKDPRGFALDKKPVKNIIDTFTQIDIRATPDNVLNRSHKEPKPKLDFTYNPANIPDWMKQIDKK